MKGVNTMNNVETYIKCFDFAFAQATAFLRHKMYKEYIEWRHIMKICLDKAEKAGYGRLL